MSKIAFDGDSIPDYYNEDNPVYSPLVGEFVKAYHNNGNYFVGKLELIDSQVCYLRPSVVSESLENYESFKYETEIPSVFNIGNICGMQRVSEDYVNGILNNEKDQLELDLNDKKR